MGVLLELADRIRITPYTARQTREAERERTRTIATLEAKVAQHLKRIESFGYGENYLDPMEQYRDGGELWYPTGYGVSGSANDRKGGQSWPFLFNEFQLQKMRGAARVLCDSNPFAIGARDRHCDFVVGDGMKAQVALRGTKPGAVASGGTVAPAVKAVQDVIDEWRELNSWGAGPWIGDIADPNDDAGYIGNKEREGYERAVVDGEVAVRFFAGGSSERGLPRIRWIEPELIVTPPGENITGPKGWGIETEPDDIERKLSYYVQGHDGIEGEYVESGRVVYGKLNTVSTVKRGVSDFAPVGPMLTRTLKLMDAMGEVSAILAQIAYLREHAPGTTSAQVSTMIGGAKDFDKSRRGGSYTTIPAQYQEPGTVHDVSNGMKYVAPPMQSGAPGFIQVEQAMLRAIGQRWGMPEFFSGDASNNNYASIAVTGSPFERAVKSRQQWYMSFQRAIYYKVIAYAVKSGRLSADDARAVEITLVPTTASATDSLKEAQRKEILNRAKVLSPQTWASQEGLDAAQETANLQAHDEAFPDVGMNAGGMFDFGGGGGDDGPAGDPGEDPTGGEFDRAMGESVVQEGFTGTKTDSLGREIHYRDGKRVGGDGDEKRLPKEKKTKKPKMTIKNLEKQADDLGREALLAIKSGDIEKGRQLNAASYGMRRAAKHIEDGDKGKADRAFELAGLLASGKHKLPTTLPESVQEGFTGTVTGVDGHEYKYVDGKRVSGAGDGSVMGGSTAAEVKLGSGEHISQKVDVPDPEGDDAFDVRVWTNPSDSQIKAKLDNLRSSQPIRGLVDGDDIYVWWEQDVHHQPTANALGLNRNIDFKDRIFISKDGDDVVVSTHSPNPAVAKWAKSKGYKYEGDVSEAKLRLFKVRAGQALLDEDTQTTEGFTGTVTGSDGHEYKPNESDFIDTEE